MFKRVLFSLIVFAIATIPFDLFLLARLFFQPEGFWQNIALTGLGIAVLGGLQVLFLILFLIITVTIWKKRQFPSIL